MIELFTKISDATKLLMEKGFTPLHASSALSMVGSALKVDRIYIYENQPYPIRGRMLVDARYAWTVPGLTSPLESSTLQSLCLRELAPQWSELLSQGHLVNCLAKDAPPRMKLLLDDHKTRSLMLAPLRPAKEWWGFVGFDDCQKARVWTAEEVILLKSLASGLSSALRHRQMRSSLSQTRSQLREMMALSVNR
ncbi:GAF domain-containing protein [Stigmatella erecta]|uniref:GAF domain-containing protein n=1 Tax=Stigmatella erecta TaxID=83460 RepID=A0A1I0I0W9_9BACT|nr:GAF domain-containing protein [Stigmatella erecta]SET90058.1 GAF domain-containing protein [Stigmatella erecta]